jgi:3D (Asp-Asp-Asp) domain-containing protein
MAKLVKKHSAKAALIIALSAFSTIAYVNSSESEYIAADVEQFNIGPLTAEEHLNSAGCADPDTFIVTAYLAIDEYENRFHGITYSGVPAKPYHTIAVDPEIIPLGSMLYIDGLGWWRAEDTGNMIKGKRLDICVESRDEAMEWGKRKLQVWYLTPDQLESRENEIKAEIASVDASNIS